VEAHFYDLDGVKRLSDVVQSERYTCYGWTKFVDPKIDKTSHAKLVFESASVLLNPVNLTQPYDWDGNPSDSLTVVFEQRELNGISGPGSIAGPSSTAQILQNIVSDITGQNPKLVVNLTNIWRAEGRTSQYSIVVPMKVVDSVFERLCRAFDLKNGVGSYELMGTASDLEKIKNGGEYQFDQFPQNCWNLNSPINLPFALARQSLVRPILNITTKRLPDAAKVLDLLGDRSRCCQISKRYLAWMLAGSEFSPSSASNYVLVKRQGSGCRIFLGFEQYADSDPAAEQFIAYATPVVAKLGARLKRTPSIL
jgi:hypothetical protein